MFSGLKYFRDFLLVFEYNKLNKKYPTGRCSLIVFRFCKIWRRIRVRAENLFLIVLGRYEGKAVSFLKRKFKAIFPLKSINKKCAERNESERSALIYNRSGITTSRETYDEAIKSATRRLYRHHNRIYYNQMNSLKSSTGQLTSHLTNLLFYFIPPIFFFS